jgi:Asp-tRNA(Asn)/Glu-tRNA(Gln) amidotransferase A subunit family amidase
MDTFFDRYDLLVTPTMPPAFRAGAASPGGWRRPTGIWAGQFTYRST